MQSTGIITFFSVLALAFADCPPPAVQNAAFTPVQSSYTDGENVTFTCNTGYGLQGSRIHYCRVSSWEGSLTCYEQFCETMNNPRNGIIVGNPSYKIGTYITFQCNTGYTLKGNSQLLCRVDLKFDRNPPTCDVNMCTDFGVIDHARIFQATDGGIENDYGSEVKVTCEDPYVLDGHASVFCQGDGTWGPKPTCKPLDCGRFDGMNSSCVEDFVLLDTLYYMECKTVVPNTRIGAPHSTSAPNECEKRSRKWMYSQFGCFCHCKVKYNKYIVKAENLDTNDYLLHDTDLNWRCIKEGCTKNQTNALRCMDGQMEMPSCTCDANVHTGEPYTTDITTKPSPNDQTEHINLITKSTTYQQTHNESNLQASTTAIQQANSIANDPTTEESTNNAIATGQTTTQPPNASTSKSSMSEQNTNNRIGTEQTTIQILHSSTSKSKPTAEESTNNTIVIRQTTMQLPNASTSNSSLVEMNTNTIIVTEQSTIQLLHSSTAKSSMSEQNTTNRIVTEQTTKHLLQSSSAQSSMSEPTATQFLTTDKQLPNAGSFSFGIRHSSIPVLIFTICIKFVVEQ
ncbi:beta-2-glycoprotein 1-like isoform X2 [Dreissena polymorpha]|uniref:beta-2-glycoprotein 1-like isoform X2 n=1 Tax=Dreissena polymorpha TaxID=45954 RepID=UPI002264686F|nr:beta-2-glycoprotein 1-like isoform X2 [Dreissena polymorpha]